MFKTIIPAAALLALSLSACATAPASKSEMAAESPNALSAEAQQALTRAEADIGKAKAAFALWIPADKAIKAAQKAAESGDSDEVIRQSRIASDLAALGLEQKGYPSTELQ